MDPRRFNAHRSTHFAALILALALVPVAFAKGGNGGKSNNGNNTSTSALTLQLVVDANNDGQPSWGDTIRFVVSNPPADPNVELACSQNGTLVYAARTGYYDNTWPSTGDMVLRSQAWTSGSADCTARLYVIDGLRTATIAKVSFTATGA